MRASCVCSIQKWHCPAYNRWCTVHTALQRKIVLDFCNRAIGFLVKGEERHVGKGKKIVYRDTNSVQRCFELGLYLAGKPMQLALFEALKSEGAGATSDADAIATFNRAAQHEWTKAQDGTHVKVFETVLRNAGHLEQDVTTLADEAVGSLTIGLLTALARMATMTESAPDAEMWDEIREALNESDPQRFSSRVKLLIEDIEYLKDSKDPRVESARSIARSLKKMKDPEVMRSHLRSCLRGRSERCIAKAVEDEHGFAMRVCPGRGGMGVQGITVRGKASTFSRKQRTRERKLRELKAYTAVRRKILTDPVELEGYRGLSSGRDAYYSFRKGDVSWDGEKDGGVGGEGRRQKGGGGMVGVSTLAREWSKLPLRQKENWCEEWKINKKEEQRAQKEKMVKKADKLLSSINVALPVEEAMLSDLKTMTSVEFVQNAHRKFDVVNPQHATSMSQYNNMFTSSFSVAEFCKQHANSVTLKSVRDMCGKVGKCILNVHKVMTNSEERENQEIQAGKRKLKTDWKALLREVGVEDGDLDTMKSNLDIATVVSFSLGDSLQQLQSESGGETPIPLRWLVAAVCYSPLSFQAIPLECLDGNVWTLPDRLHTEIVMDSDMCAAMLTGKAVVIYASSIGFLRPEIPMKSRVGLLGDEVTVAAVEEGVMEVLKEKKENKKVTLGPAMSDGIAAVGDGGGKKTKTAKASEDTTHLEVKMAERVKKAADFCKLF